MIPKKGRREIKVPDYAFIINSILIGAGLAMDAFTVSCANGMAYPDMKPSRRWMIAGTFAGFQFLMPLTGWFLVHTVVEVFSGLSRWIPMISLILLGWIGFNMIREAISGGEEEEKGYEKLTAGLLIIQGIATSIDALSVGFTIASYDWPMAFICSLIIFIVTYYLCIVGVRIGCRFGTIFQDKALFLGGLILIGIGLEIFLKNL